VKLTAGAVTGSTAGALAGSVTLAGGAATTGTNGGVNLHTSGTDGAVGLRTQSSFTGTTLEHFTYGQQVSLSASSQTNIVTLGTLSTVGHNMKFEIYVTGVDNSSLGDHVSFKLIQTYYNTAVGLFSMTAHLSDSQNSGTGGFASDVTFNLTTSSGNIILRAQNGSSTTAYTGNLCVWWTRQEGGFTS
jgi:hypothetical protein